MPSHSMTRSPSPHTAAPLGRSSSLLSRIKAPFGSKARHIAEFYVQPDDPHRQYTPGDVITGSVILKLVKPLRVTHVTACLHGFVQVYKTPNNPGQSYREYTGSSTPGKTAKTGYFGNGFASLFQDEVILCGEGRLAEGMYQFEYELVFPKDKLPSSIDFERGTISYMITSTLTKPTTISPTTVCDRKVSLTEDLDVATLRTPMPRVITLEPLSRRGRARHIAKKKAQAAENDPKPRRSGQADAPSDQDSRTPVGPPTDGDQPTSPAASETSFGSCMSSCETSSDMRSASQSRSAVTTGSGAARTHPSSSHSSRPIKATIELSRQGFLRGDPIHLRIFIQHRKLVKSIHGVIVTLYRQARVDMHPALPVIGKDGQGKTEDYYPKSKTGLGGLSLSSAGSSHVFRKDLSQTFASIIVNPDTLTADIKAAVRVPEGAFPSISTVPGAMISFKYYVEVVLDLQGKLAGLDRLFPSGGLGVGTGFGTDAVGSPVSHMIDTQEIRREKSVVSCVFEVVIGTRDSDRGAWRRRLQTFLERGRPGLEDEGGGTPLELRDSGEVQVRDGGGGAADQVQQQQQRHLQHADAGAEDCPYDGSNISYADDAGPYRWDEDFQHGGGGGSGYGNEPPPPHPHPPLVYPPDPPPPPPPRPPHSVPPPSLEDESSLPEKERLRRAEERLLPSQPPDTADPEGQNSTSTMRNLAPTAPMLPHDSLLSSMSSAADASAPRGSLLPRGDAAGAGPEPLGPAPEYPGPRLEVAPAAAAAASAAASASASLLPTDDKMELRRRELQARRSAPEDDDHDDDVDGDDDDDASASAPPPPLPLSLPLTDPASGNGAAARARARARSGLGFLVGVDDDDDDHGGGIGRGGGCRFCGNDGGGGGGGVGGIGDAAAAPGAERGSVFLPLPRYER